MTNLSSTAVSASDVSTKFPIEDLEAGEKGSDIQPDAAVAELPAWKWISTIVGLCLGALLYGPSSFQSPSSSPSLTAYPRPRHNNRRRRTDTHLRALRRDREPSLGRHRFPHGFGRCDPLARTAVRFVRCEGHKFVLARVVRGWQCALWCGAQYVGTDCWESHCWHWRGRNVSWVSSRKRCLLELEES